MVRSEYDRDHETLASGPRTAPGQSERFAHARRRLSSPMFTLTLLSLIGACVGQPLGPDEGQQSENLNVSPRTVWLSVGDSQTVVAWLTGPEADGDTITYSWVSSDPGVVEVGADGVLHAKRNGSAKIDVMADKPGKRVGHRKNAVTVTVTDTQQEASIARILGVPSLVDRWNDLPFTHTYDSVFEQWGETHWGRSAGQWEYTYYDRALAWYAAWWRTGDAKYLERGHTDVKAYRDDYVLPNDGHATPKWVFTEGLAIHYLLTGDEASKTAIDLMARWMVQAGWLDNMMTTQYQDGRIQGRTVMAQLVALEVTGNALFRERLDTGVDNLLEWYNQAGGDGSWDMKSYCDGQANFQVAHAILDVLQRYYDLVNPDPRIPPVVKNSLDRMWLFWNPGAGFNYIGDPAEDPCPGVGSTAASKDLNLLIVPAFAWYYEYSGDATYLNRADEIWDTGLVTTFWSGSKQFNQSFMRSWRYPHLTN